MNATHHLQSTKRICCRFSSKVFFITVREDGGGGGEHACSSILSYRSSQSIADGFYWICGLEQTGNFYYVYVCGLPCEDESDYHLEADSDGFYVCGHDAFEQFFASVKHAKVLACACSADRGLLICDVWYEDA